jgi:hypothetical protein
MSKYSANPAQTPAIFFSAITRRSRFGGADDEANDDEVPLAEYPGGGAATALCVSPVIGVSPVMDAPHAVQ